MKTTLATLFALGLTAGAASAQGLSLPTLPTLQMPDLTVGIERATEAEDNTIWGTVGIGFADVTLTAEDTNGGMDFSMQKYEIDFSQPIGPATLYMKNDFNTDFKHTETTIGASFAF
jgi:hypothetical protein